MHLVESIICHREINTRGKLCIMGYIPGLPAGVLSAACWPLSSPSQFFSGVGGSVWDRSPLAIVGVAHTDRADG